MDSDDRLLITSEMARELERLELEERAAWRGWHASKERDGIGDPGQLMAISKVIEARCHLLGLYTDRQGMADRQSPN